MSIISDATAEIPVPDEPQPDGVEDDEAFSRFFDQYHASVYTVAWRVLGDEAKASDVTETVFCRAWRASAHRRARSPQQRRWLLWLTHGIAMSAYHREATAMAHLHTDDVLLDAQVPGQSCAPAPSLPNAQRAVELALWSGLACREIADSCGSTAEEVRTQIRVGLRLLGGGCAPATASQQCSASTCEAPPPASYA